MHCCALIVAAGRGVRLGSNRPKQFLPLLGRPMLLWSIDAFARSESVQSLVLVVAASELEPTRRLLARWSIDEQTFGGGFALCAGGDTRFESSQRGLAHVPAAATHIAIHDAARPLVTPELIERVIARAARDGAALPLVGVRETVKQVDEHDVVTQTVDREQLRLAQTPQVVERALLERAYAAYDGGPLTDDVQLVEALGERVHGVEGDPANIKVTLTDDMTVAEALLERRRNATTGRFRESATEEHDAVPRPLASLPRTGFGFDVHALEAGDAVILGGVRIECGMRLVGHSDADVLAHAAGDALLGAASLGDLGKHFPPSDERWAGADSIELLAQIARLVDERGFRVGNLDCVVVCEEPKLAPYIDEMRQRLASAVKAEVDAVSVKATTSERLGFTGRGEGIAAYATVLIAPRG